jgi:hypothetical protein
MQDFAELLKGIAAVLWPLVVVVAIIIFRKEVSALLTRLRKAKFLGGELELDESLDRLERTAEALEAEATSGSQELESPTVGGPDDIVPKILEEASRSPKVALMLLSAELDRAVRELLASLGGEPRSRSLSLRKGLEELAQRTSLPDETLPALDQFSEVRNLIVHGRGQVSNDEILRAIDSGLVILKAIRAVPHESHAVHRDNVDLYSDSECKQLREDCKGVTLESLSAGGAITKYRIFPTTRDDYKKGMRVSWEWNGSSKWGNTWYRDPESGEIKYAWTSSVEFVGRDLDRL